MPLSNGYGVIIGTKDSYHRDPPDNYGRYYHGNLTINTPAGKYHCAIDVDSKFMPDGVQWRKVQVKESDFLSIKQLADGWHSLISSSSSGALDYIRSPALHPPFLIYFVRHDSQLQCFLNWLRWNPPWNNGTGIQALTELESIINLGIRFYVFGEPFTSDLGVHNIHQNQGDPLNSNFSIENGIWQDGCTIVETAEGDFIAFLNKFKTQSFKTNDAGKPIP